MISATEALERAFETNDAAEVARILSTTTETERRRLRSVVRQRVSSTYDILGKQSALAVAALGTVGGARQAAQALDHAAAQGAEDVAAQLLAALRPSWLPDLPTAILSER